MNAMAEVGADPALVYAFQKTGVYVCEENEKSLSEDSLRALRRSLQRVAHYTAKWSSGMRYFTEDFADSWTYKLPYEAV